MDTTYVKALNEIGLHVNQPLITSLIITVGINLLLTIISLGTQIYLKNHEKKINAFNIRETNRIKILEEVYARMINLTLYTGVHSNSQFISELNEFRIFIQEKRIYINKNIQKLIHDYIAYLEPILNNYTLKNIKKEDTFFERFDQLFNK